jgi:DNA-binding protein HU-beta
VNLIDINKRRHAMNKAELVEEVAGKVGLTKKETNKVVDVVMSTITDSLARNERVTLVGFGTFEVRRRRARKGVNPQTRKTIQIPARNVPKFVPGKSLREAIA